MRFAAIITCLSILFSSCYSYQIFPKEYRDFQYAGEKKTAYVVNPELRKEFRILEKSGIFRFTDDSTDASAVQVRLYPIQRNLMCGQPVIASLFTLGQLPVYLPDTYEYRFDETDGKGIAGKDFRLKIATRYWFWDLFAFRKKFSKKAGQTLQAEYYHQ